MPTSISSTWTKPPAPPTMRERPESSSARTRSTSARMDTLSARTELKHRHRRTKGSPRGNEGSSRGTDVSPCGNEGSPWGNDVGKGQDDVSGVRNDVSVDRTADGARRHLSEGRCRVGQRGLPDGGWARILPLFHADAVMPHANSHPEGRRSVYWILSGLRVPGALYGTTSRPGRSADMPMPSPFPRCSGAPPHDALPPIQYCNYLTVRVDFHP